MKKGIFPYFAEGLQTVSEDADWDGVSGFVNVTLQCELTFDVDNYNGPGEPVIESGAAVLVQNSSSDNVDVVLPNGNLRDTDSVTAQLGAKESVTVLYHESYGFAFLGGVEAQIT